MNRKIYIVELKRLLKATLDERCEAELYTLNIHMLDQMGDDLDGFGCLESLDALPFQRFSEDIEQVYRTKTSTAELGMVEKVGVIGTRKARGFESTGGTHNVELPFGS